MSRRRYRVKRRACGLCKPHKRGWVVRWKPRELAITEVADREAASFLKKWVGVGSGSGAGVAERHDDFLYGDDT